MRCKACDSALTEAESRRKRKVVVDEGHFMVIFEELCDVCHRKGCFPLLDDEDAEYATQYLEKLQHPEG